MAVTPDRMRSTASKLHSGMSKAQFNDAALVQPIKAYGYQNRLGTKITTGVAYVGCEEIILFNFYRQLTAEFFGTFMLLWIGCGCVTDIAEHDEKGALTMASMLLGWGFLISSLVWTIASVSGCFLNPAVTMAMLVNRRVPLVRALGYIGVQICGGIAGAAYHSYTRGDMKTTCQTLLNRNKGVDIPRGFLIEFTITFFLVFLVFATIDTNRQDHGGAHAVVVGGVIMPLVNVGAEATGASMNPARSLGPAVVHGNWDDHWLYWVAPITGACAGGLFYDLVFSERMVAWSRFLQFGDTEVNELEDEDEEWE